ncbi:hypothetical protein GCM10023185_35680 [Hymenobacter saemangeumensis]|uniref:Transporter n=2 Tax=Hymenobacter saemangeumensis TaxID=1084522 RepID=A0ABP8IPK4_9BACT
MAGKGQGSVVISGTTEQYKNVFLVPEKVNGVPIFEEVRVSSLNLYGTYGITDKLDVILSVPYIRSEGKADPRIFTSPNYTNSRQGFQDFSGILKYKLYSRELGSSILDVLGVAGVSTPISNYETSQGLEYIIAIGNRATKYTAAGVAHLKTASGVFLTGQAGYSLRENPVPNAFVGEAKVGYAGPKTYVEAYASFQKSDGGTDILQPGFDGLFTATKVDYVRVGVSIFRPIAKGVGVVLGANTYVAGRNLGQSTGFSAGISYNL